MYRLRILVNMIAKEISYVKLRQARTKFRYEIKDILWSQKKKKKKLPKYWKHFQYLKLIAVIKKVLIEIREEYLQGDIIH